MANSKRSKLILRLCLTAMFLAFAVVSKLLLPINIPLLGAGGMKVGLAGVFTAFPAFMFGPLYGGFTSALSDLLGYLVKPDGAYIPWLTLTAFLGGFLKGLIWLVVVKLARRDTRIAGRVRLVTMVLLFSLGILGLTLQLSLNGSGVMNGFTAVQSELPTRGRIETMELNPSSGFVASLAKYNNDSFTLTGVTEEAETASEYGAAIIVPATLTFDGYESKLTKIGANAFSECGGIDVFFLSANVSSIDAAAFEGLDGFIIAAPEGSKAAAFAADHNIEWVDAVADDTLPAFVSDGKTTVADGGLTVKSSDTFRKYLAGYANFATLGLEIISLAGMLFIVVDWLVERAVCKKYGEKKRFNLMMIFISIFLSGIIVTTINTEILKYFLAAWNGREFMLLWVPRAIEEMVVCLVQAYIISVLYGVYISKIAGRGRFAGLDRSLEEKPLTKAEKEKTV